MSTAQTHPGNVTDRNTASPWWRDAVVYQIYPRSFADANGDGMGDLAGVSTKLPYLKNLGVDAVWLSPFYVSPQADGGYDVADYRAVDPLFGTLADFDELLARAHELELKVIVDLVPNHTSDEHLWFRQARTAAPGSPERARYIFRDGRGPDHSLPPNNWQSVFGGSAWTRITEPDGAPGQWYLHLFDTSQPDLNWDNPEVRAEMVSVLRFWLDRGVDGFRVDVAHGLVKAAGLPDWSARSAMVAGNALDNTVPASPPYFDQDGVHEIFREWHRVLAEYPGDRMMVAEAWVEPAERLFAYVRPDEMQQAFNFGYLLAGWDAARMSRSIDESLLAAATVGAPGTWVLSNHDTVRHTSRFGLADPTSYPKGISAEDEQPDEELGLARARTAALVMLALPGSAYVYQGEELGLPEHTTLPAEARQDPSFFRTGGAERGRDGSRVPLPWRAEARGYGWGSSRHAPWLPQPASFARYAADRQVGVDGSTYEFYRSALRLRADHGLGRGTLVWNDGHDPAAGILSYRNRGLVVLANMGQEPVPLPAGYRVALASGPGVAAAGELAADAAVWLLPAGG